MSSILSTLRILRRSTMFLLLIASRSFTVVSHTVAAVGGFVSAAIYGVSGIATTTVTLPRHRLRARTRWRVTWRRAAPAPEPCAANWTTPCVQ